MSSSSAPACLRGATRPRVEVAPPYVDSRGQEAVELARLAGLELDFWQQQALVLMLAVREDGKWACREYAEIVARQNGKGAILEARALAGLLLFGEKLIMWSAHEYKTAMEAFLRVKILIDNLIRDGIVEADEIKIINTNGEEGFEILATGQRLKFIARSKSSGRGFSGDVNIIDEAFAYTPQQHAALAPTMNARPNPQTIYTSSPPLDSESGEILYALRTRAESGESKRLGWRDWGIEGDLDNLGKINLDDRSLWAAANPSCGIRDLNEEALELNRESMSSNGGLEFAREILGVWPKLKIGGGAIDMARWTTDLRDPESRRAGDIAVAVDIAPKRGYAAIALWGVRDDELGHGQLLSYKPGTAWVLARLIEIRDTLGPFAIAMGRGTWKSLETELIKQEFQLSEDLEQPERGDLMVATAMDMSAACGHLLDAVKDATFRHIGQTELDASVQSVKLRTTLDSVAWATKDADGDTAPTVALTLARWAYTSRIHLVQNDYDVMESVF